MRPLARYRLGMRARKRPSTASIVVRGIVLLVLIVGVLWLALPYILGHRRRPPRPADPPPGTVTIVEPDAIPGLAAPRGRDAGGAATP